MNETNPVVLQISGQWHIVEHSRRSETSLCGKRVANRGAHARLSVVGEKNTCAKCLKLFREINPIPPLPPGRREAGGEDPTSPSPKIWERGPGGENPISPSPEYRERGLGGEGQ